MSTEKTCTFVTCQCLSNSFSQALVTDNYYIQYAYGHPLLWINNAGMIPVVIPPALPTTVIDICSNKCGVIIWNIKIISFYLLPIAYYSVNLNFSWMYTYTKVRAKARRSIREKTHSPLARTQTLIHTRMQARTYIYQYTCTINKGDCVMWHWCKAVYFVR